MWGLSQVVQLIFSRLASYKKNYVSVKTLVYSASTPNFLFPTFVFIKSSLLAKVRLVKGPSFASVKQCVNQLNVRMDKMEL